MNPVAILVVSKELFDVQTSQIRGDPLREPGIVPALAREEAGEELLCHSEGDDIARNVRLLQVWGGLKQIDVHDGQGGEGADVPIGSVNVDCFAEGIWVTCAQ